MDFANEYARRCVSAGEAVRTMEQVSFIRGSCPVSRRARRWQFHAEWWSISWQSMGPLVWQPAPVGCPPENWSRSPTLISETIWS